MVELTEEEKRMAVEETFERINDPIKFAETFFNFPIYDYNKKFLTDQSRRIIYRGGRKVGKSSMAAMKCLHLALSKENTEIIIVAPTQRQAMILFWKIKDFLHNSDLMPLVIRETQTMLFFSTGSKIISLPSGYTSQNIRGFTPSLIICLPHQMKVRTNEGDIRIGDIVENSRDVKVLTYNFENKIMEWSKIKKYIKTPLGKRQIITLNNSFQCTDDHLIYTDKGYLRAGDLTKNNIVYIAFDGIFGWQIEEIKKGTGQEILHKEKEFVYDLALEKNHNFFANGILVHNCDESAYIPDDAYIALEPSIATTNGQMILIGTPFGKRGRYYTAWNDNEFSKYEVKSKENPLITSKFLDGVRNDGSMTESEYLQEFEAEFVEESSCYFSHKLILDALIRSDVKAEKNKDKKYYLGVDIARYGRDATVYVTLEMTEGGRGRVIRIDDDIKKPITHVAGRVLDLNDIYNYEKIFVDETALGSGGVDILKEKLDNVEGVTFSLRRKSELYKNLKILLEKGRLKFINDERLINQLMALVYEYTSDGQLKIHAPERIHDDVPDAVCLACMGFEMGTAVVVLDVPDEVKIFE